jgi:hypothetical protein
MGQTLAVATTTRRPGLRRAFAAIARLFQPLRRSAPEIGRDGRHAHAWQVVGGAAIAVGEDGTIEHVIIGGP